MIKKILVIGGTGMLGKPVVERLKKSHFKVRLLVRDLEKAKNIFRGVRGLEFVEGDVRDVESLKAAMEDQDAVYLNLSVRPDEKRKEFHAESDGLINIIEAAKASDIQRISYLSSLISRYKMLWWVMRLKKRAIELVKESGIPYTIYYPSTFMESILNQYKMGRNLLVIGKPKYALHWIAAEDYGLQVAKSYKIDESGNHEYVIQGPEAVTIEAAFEQFVRDYEPQLLRIRKMKVLGALRLAGLAANKIRYGAKITECINNYPEKFEAIETWNKLGKPKTTIQKFARSF